MQRGKKCGEEKIGEVLIPKSRGAKLSDVKKNQKGKGGADKERGEAASVKKQTKKISRNFADSKTGKGSPLGEKNGFRDVC